MCAVPGAVTHKMSLSLSPVDMIQDAYSLPGAALTFDKFHVIKLLNEADDVERTLPRHTRPNS